MVTLVDGLDVIDINGKKDTIYKNCFGRNPAYVNLLRIWGQAVTSNIKTDITSMVADIGVHCMMVGYVLDHNGDCYKMHRAHKRACIHTFDGVYP